MHGRLNKFPYRIINLLSCSKILTMQPIKRREFLKTSALSATGAAFLPTMLSKLAMPVRHLGVQLYSVRDDMAKNPVATLEAVARMGFKEVEGYGYKDGKMFGMSISEYSKVLKSNGLSMPTSHCSFSFDDYDEGKKVLSDRAKAAIDDAIKMGQRYVIFPWLPEQDRKQVEKIVKLVSAAADYAQKAGIRFGYHNHDFEFIQRGPDGRLLMEWILQEIDPAKLILELDLYWVSYAGYNPLDWFRLYPGRWKCCHVKDMAATEKRETIEVGDGTINFPAIFRQSKQAGLEHYIIELEHYRTTPLEGIKRARKNFLAMKW